MNINIYIEDQLEKALRQFALTEHKTRNAIIREAIFEWTQRHKKTRVAYLHSQFQRNC